MVPLLVLTADAGQGWTANSVELLVHPPAATVGCGHWPFPRLGPVCPPYIVLPEPVGS